MSAGHKSDVYHAYESLPLATGYYLQSFHVETTTVSTRVHVRWMEVEWSTVSVHKGILKSIASMNVSALCPVEHLSVCYKLHDPPT